MVEEKWNDFFSTGKISDYLEYKNFERVGESSGDDDSKGSSTEGIPVFGK